MIEINIKIFEDYNETIFHLPQSPPPVDLMIKVIMVCQFDLEATNAINDKIKSLYGEEYHTKILTSMSEILNSFREIIQNSASMDPEMSSVPVVYAAPRLPK